MNAKLLREQLEQLNDDAEVLIWINGVTFEVGALGIENHDATHTAPYVVLQLGSGYRYRARS